LQLTLVVRRALYPDQAGPITSLKIIQYTGEPGVNVRRGNNDDRIDSAVQFCERWLEIEKQVGDCEITDKHRARHPEELFIIEKVKKPKLDMYFGGDVEPQKHCVFHEPYSGLPSQFVEDVSQTHR
jgi:hypothetical protein